MPLAYVLDPLLFALSPLESHRYADSAAYDARWYGVPLDLRRNIRRFRHGADR